MFKHPIDTSKLWVVTAISNPVRYKSRYDLYETFKTGVHRVGANLMTVELALGARSHIIAESNASNERHVKLSSFDELWHKENMLNVGISRLPPDWEYVAWIDADVEILRHDWPQEIVHQLQHHMVIQPFQTAIDSGPNGEVLNAFDSFTSSFVLNKPKPGGKRNAYVEATTWHPGFAWAARREAIDHLGGLIDYAVLGAADHHMAWALVNDVARNTPKECTPAYIRKLKEWETRANVHIRQDLGFASGCLLHHWHGKKSDRRYTQRWNILHKHGFDPDKDIKRDWQGVISFTDEGERMRNDIRTYFRQRNEDSIDNE